MNDGLHQRCGDCAETSLITVLCHNDNLGVDCKNTNKRAKYKIETHFLAIRSYLSLFAITH